MMVFSFPRRRGTTLLALLLAARTSSAILHKHLSFVPPFLDVDHFGKRMVGYEWDLTGAAKAMKNFVRLTPDQQSKTGGLWSVDAVGNTVFSSVIEFRLSGKGDRFFGDGLAFWVVEPERKHDLYDMHYGDYMYDDDIGGGWGGGLKDLRADLPSGDFHGFVEKFKGLGVIVDTYRNEEFFHAHKDFTVVYNTGNMTREEMVAASSGCNGQVRYYESRADFDPGSLSSRVKVDISGNTLMVKVDPKNTKTWEDCAQIELPKEMGEGWTKAAHLGLTASTGQLSDNHDVIRLETYVSSDAAETGEKRREQATPAGLDTSVPFLERVANMENIMNAMLVKMELMDVHQEHNVAKVEEHVKELFEKTAQNERGLADSLDVLERKVRELEVKIKRQLESQMEAGIGEAHAAARGWRLPFFVLLTGVTGGAIASYRVYRTLRKSHFL